MPVSLLSRADSFLPLFFFFLFFCESDVYMNTFTALQA